MKYIIGSLAAIMLLAGCAAGGDGPTPKGSVVALQAALTAAERAALIYVSLPRCAPNAPPVCSQPAIVATVKASDERAYQAVIAAQGAVNADPSASNSATRAAISGAEAALAGFRAVTETLPRGN